MPQLASTNLLRLDGHHTRSEFEENGGAIADIRSDVERKIAGPYERAVEAQHPAVSKPRRRTDEVAAAPRQPDEVRPLQPGNEQSSHSHRNPSLRSLMRHPR